MNKSIYNLKDTIFAPITSKFSGSVCVFRISGNRACDILSNLSAKNITPNQAIFSKLFYENRKILDECVVTFFQFPKSFTGEDCIEVSLHGSEYIYNEFIKLLTKNFNFRFASNGEFLYRALVNQKIDILKAESIDALIKSCTEKQHKFAIRQGDDENRKIYQNWYQEFISIYSLVESNIDFSDQEIPESTMEQIKDGILKIKNEMSFMLGSKSQKKIFDGINIAILGLPNAGKSSLLNALCKENIAIVSNTAGTTRDLISTKIDIDGYLVNILDTAGIRKDSKDEIEIEGIRRAISAVKIADIRIFVFEYGIINQELYDTYHQESDIIIASKCDIKMEKNEKYIKVSTTKNLGIDELISALKKSIEKILPNVNEDICISDRQKNILCKCFEVIQNLHNIDEIECFAQDLRDIISYMGEIFGYTSIDDILGNIFSKFCIGK